MNFSTLCKRTILCIILLGGISQVSAFAPDISRPGRYSNVSYAIRTVEKVAMSRWTHYAVLGAVVASPFYWGYKYWNRRAEFKAVDIFLNDTANGTDIYPVDKRINIGNFQAATYILPQSVLDNATGIAVILRNQVDARKRSDKAFSVAQLLEAVSNEEQVVRAHLKMLEQFTDFPKMLAKNTQFSSVARDARWNTLNNIIAICKHPELFTDVFIQFIEGPNGKGGILASDFEDTFSRGCLHAPGWKVWRWQVAPRFAKASQLYWDVVKRFARTYALYKIINANQTFIDGKANAVVEIRSGQAEPDPCPQAPRARRVDQDYDFAWPSVCVITPIEEILNDIQVAFVGKTLSVGTSPDLNQLFKQLLEQITYYLQITDLKWDGERLSYRAPLRFNPHEVSNMFVSLKFIKQQIERGSASQDFLAPMFNKLKIEINILYKTLQS